MSCVLYVCPQGLPSHQLNVMQVNIRETCQDCMLIDCSPSPYFETAWLLPRSALQQQVFPCNCLFTVACINRSESMA